jgi:isopentenyldiphosphate isomerase
LSTEIFDIINEYDEVVGTAPRAEAHRKGLRHRAIHVLFVTPARELILQRRSMSKDTQPGYLTVTVGGHVPSGKAYDETAVKEIFEETGLRLSRADLTPMGDLSYDVHDPVTRAHDCELVRVYGHRFKGKISNLRIEPGEGAGFETWNIDRLMNLSAAEGEKYKIAPGLLSKAHYVPLFPKFLELCK